MGFRLQRWLLLLAFLPPTALVLGEVVARVGNLPGVTRWRDPVLFCVPALHRASPFLRRHPSYLWTFAPNTSLRVHNDSPTPKMIRIDEHGFRRTPWNHAEDDGIRWMFLGDSMVFCWSAPPGSTFPDALVGMIGTYYGVERMASFNLGIPAFSSYQSLRVLKGEYSRVRPDIVIFWGGSNDNTLANIYSDPQFMRLYGGVMFYIRRTLDRSAFIRWTRTLTPNAKNAHEGYRSDSGTRKRVEPPEFRKNVREMARYSRAHGAEFLALTREHVGREEAIAEYNKMLRQLEAEDHVDIVDICDIYSVALDEGLMRNYPQDRCHFNAKGYRRTAKKVAERIITDGWIDTLLNEKRQLCEEARQLTE